LNASLRPLVADELDGFLETVKAGYTSEMIRAGLTPELAQAKSDRDHAALLPNGVDTPDHHLFSVEDDGAHAGYLWLAERRGELGHSLFVYGIEIDEERRGRGLGRAAMELAEEEARSRGIASISLNVFGGNDVARGLYRSLGYSETAIYMEKKL
jgi:ribosomal protein S18 acetylase RimI-like enzyme